MIPKNYNYFRYSLLFFSIIYALYSIHLIYFSSLPEYKSIELSKQYIYISLIVSLPLSLPIFILFQAFGVILLFFLGDKSISSYPSIEFLFIALQYITPIVIIHLQWFMLYPKKKRWTGIK